jgi:hypothetical protein
MGKGLDLERLWKDYDHGVGYIEKVSTADLHLLRLTFGHHPASQPLFDAEAIFKTVKGTFHDVKAECFSQSAYDECAPIFLHRVERGSGIFEFLAQFDPVMTWIVALGGAAMWYRKALVSDQDFDEKRFSFIRTNFPGADAKDMRAYMKAWTTFGRRRVLQRLIGQHLERVEVSMAPVRSDLKPPMLDMNPIVNLDESPEDG